MFLLCGWERAINQLVATKTNYVSSINIWDDTSAQVFWADFGFEKVFHDVHCIKGEEKCMFHESTTRILVF